MSSLPRWVEHPWLTRFWVRAVLLIAAGLLLPLAFAPFNLWPLGWLSLALVFFVLRVSAQKPAKSSGKQLFLLGWLFGLGLYGFGLSWVYHSMQVVNTPAWLSVLMTSLFCAAIGLTSGVNFLVWHWLQTRIQTHWHWILFAALWVIFEWLRSWIFTGLPWLLVGSSVSDYWLSGWLPVVGVYGVSFFIAAASALLVTAWFNGQNRYCWGWVSAAMVLLFGLGLLAKQVHWTSAQGSSIDAVALQGNIDQRTKWQRKRIIPTFELYRDFTLIHSDADLVVWPEAAITEVTSQAEDLLNALTAVADATDTAIVTGIIADGVDEAGRYQMWNALLGLGNASGEYYKTQMVPFGEYVPFASLLRGVIEFFDLPMSALVPGPRNPEVLHWDQTDMAPLICYEIAYPGLVRKLARDAGIIVTVSNDSWFGASIGPHQHLQIARIRAMETERPVVRATQDGMSAIIDGEGQVLAIAEKFQRTAIRAEIQPAQGLTPYLRFGHLWQIGLLIALIGWLYFKRRSASEADRL